MRSSRQTHLIVRLEQVGLPIVSVISDRGYKHEPEEVPEAEDEDEALEDEEEPPALEALGPVE